MNTPPKNKSVATVLGFPGSDSPVFTVPEMAEFLKVPPGQVRSLIRRGVVRYMRVGKQYIVPRADVEAWLAGSWQRKGEFRKAS